MNGTRIRRRVAALATAAVAATVLASTVSCSAVEKALDCGEFAVDISTDAAQFSEAMAQADSDPQGALDALRRLEQDTEKLADRSDNADVDKAVIDLDAQIDETREALDAGRVPNPAPVLSAAGEIAKVCTPG